MNDVFVVDAVRTWFGRFRGGLSGARPDDLAAWVLRALVDRNPTISDRLDDVYFGNANGAGEENRNVARMAVLLAGLPVSVPGATVNRLCGSSLEAVIQGRRAIAVGDADLIVAGGVESMTRAPWVVPKPDRGFPHAEQTMFSTSLGWRMVNPRMPAQWTVPMGEGAELLADRYGISRDEQDAFALRSHTRAALALESGRLGTEVAAGEWDLGADESLRRDTSLETLANLRPAFRADGTVTAGNSSPLNDGAAAVLLASAGAVDRLGLSALARVAGCGVSGVSPELFGLGPVEASRRALKAAGASLDDVRVVEINEAFAAQVLACLRELPELHAEIVNPNGGAIAIGHPLGATGARLVGTLAYQLAAMGGGLGLATACIGVGQGLAVVLESCVDREVR
jgi:acetyl-CoA acetyltransferase family protein